MSDMEFDVELARVADHVARLGRDVEISAAHRSRLRAQLLQRHGELVPRRRFSFDLWFRSMSLRRLRFLAPASLGAAVAMTAALWGLEASGHRSTDSVEAERITSAMVRTAPTVTGWKWTVTNHLANATKFSGFTTPLTGRVYLYKYSGKLIPYWRIDGQWKGVPVETRGSVKGTDWQWAFAQLPVRLAEHRAQVLHGTRQVQGKNAVGVEYGLSGSPGVQVRAIAWVDPASGKILLLQREVLHGKSVFEEDSVRYLYKQGGK